MWRWDAQRDVGGSSVGAHLAVVAKRLGPKVSAAAPNLPAAIAYLWAAYCELDDARQVGMGFGPITETDLFFYGANRGFRWEPFELAAIRALDKAHRLHHAEQQQKRS